jgi:insulysin
MLSEMSMNIFVHGNATEEDAKAIADQVTQILHSKPIFESQWPRQRVVELEQGKSYVISKPGPHTSDENSAIYSWFPVCNEDDMYNCALLYLMGEVLREQCYDQLRTKEQLGYIVWSGTRSSCGVEGWRVTVQSAVKDPIYLDQRIESFIQNSKERLDKLPEEQFKKFVTAKIVKYLEKEHTLRELHSRYWEDIKGWKNNFYRFNTLADVTKTLTKAELQKFFTKVIYEKESRRRISSRVFGNKHTVQPEPPCETVPIVNFENPTAFRRGMPLYPYYG